MDNKQIKELIYKRIEDEAHQIREESPEQTLAYRNRIDKFILFLQEGFEKILTDFSINRDQEGILELSEAYAKHAESLEGQSEADLLENLSSTGQSAATSLGFSEQLLEKIYQCGLHYYNQNKLSDASHVLAVLNMLEPTYFSSWLSLGMILEKEKKWEQSLEALKVASQLEVNNPLPHLHEAICYSNLSKIQEADAEFDAALELAKTDPSFKGIVKEIQIEREKVGRR